MAPLGVQLEPQVGLCSQCGIRLFLSPCPAPPPAGACVSRLCFHLTMRCDLGLLTDNKVCFGCFKRLQFIHSAGLILLYMQGFFFLFKIDLFILEKKKAGGVADREGDKQTPCQAGSSMQGLIQGPGDQDLSGNQEVAA